MQLAGFWIAKALEALGGFLLMASPLFSLAGVSSRSAEVAGAAMIALFLVLVTPVLHHPSTDQTGFMKNLSLLGGALYVIAGSSSSAKVSKKEKQ